jgi:hypothetical protein
VCVADNVDVCQTADQAVCTEHSQLMAIDDGSDRVGPPVASLRGWIDEMVVGP